MEYALMAFKWRIYSSKGIFPLNNVNSDAQEMKWFSFSALQLVSIKGEEYTSVS